MPFDFFKKKAADVELPNESGRVDKRLPKPSTSPFEQLKKSYGTFKKMTSSDDPIKGLKDAGNK